MYNNLYTVYCVSTFWGQGVFQMTVNVTHALPVHATHPSLEERAQRHQLFSNHTATCQLTNAVIKAVVITRN